MNIVSLCPHQQHIQPNSPETLQRTTQKSLSVDKDYMSTQFAFSYLQYSVKVLNNFSEKVQN